jgi:hypothetical protein
MAASFHSRWYPGDLSREHGDGVMAGHRQARNAPRRDRARTDRMRERYESEPDPVRRLGWAYDWLRFELAHLSRSRAADGPARAESLTLRLAAQLAASAQEISKGSDSK